MKDFQKFLNKKEKGRDMAKRKVGSGGGKEEIWVKIKIHALFLTVPYQFKLVLKLGKN